MFISRAKDAYCLPVIVSTVVVSVTDHGRVQTQPGHVTLELVLVTLPRVTLQLVMTRVTVTRAVTPGPPLQTASASPTSATPPLPLAAADPEAVL